MMQKETSKSSPRKEFLSRGGGISRYGVGCAYHLSLHSRDATLIKDIHQKLDNIGVIYEYKTKPDCRLAIATEMVYCIYLRLRLMRILYYLIIN